MSGPTTPVGMGALPITIVVAAGAPVQDGVHVLARIEVPDLIRGPVFLVFDATQGRIAVTVPDGGNSYVELAALLLSLSQNPDVAAQGASAVH